MVMMARSLSPNTVLVFGLFNQAPHLLFFQDQREFAAGGSDFRKVGQWVVARFQVSHRHEGPIEVTQHRHLAVDG